MNKVIYKTDFYRIIDETFFHCGEAMFRYYCESCDEFMGCYFCEFDYDEKHDCEVYE